MKKTNKGYSLVELLLTMAIFSIVMIAIVNIMSNASKSYKKGLLEVKIQEDSQIATNQISDLLVDAKSVVQKSSVSDPEGTVTNISYTFKDIDNNNVQLDYGDNKIYLVKDGEKALLVDNVKSFSIAGVGGTTVTEAQKLDNLCEVILELEVNDGTKTSASYKSTREVSFRNMVEYNPQASLLMNNASGDDDDDDSDDFAGTETVDRGAPINLSCTYDYTKDCHLSDEASKYFEVVTSTAFGKPAFSVRLKNSYDNPANFTSLNLNDPSIYAYETDDAGNPINKVKLEVEPVSVSSESGILLLTLDNVNHGGGNTTYVPTKGIDVNQFIKSGGSVSVQTVVTCDGVTKTGDYKTVSYSNAGDVAYNTSSIGQINIEYPGGKGRWEIGLSADQCSGGMSVVTNNTVFFKEAGNYPNDKSIVFNIKFSKNGTEKIYPIEYKVQFTGEQDISKLQ